MRTRTGRRIVAFIDVIGWSAAFDDPQVGHDKLVEVATSIGQYKQLFSPQEKTRIAAFTEKLQKDTGIPQSDNAKYHDIEFSFVSDCFVISSMEPNIVNLLNVCRWACMTLLGDHGFLTRGGVTVGTVTHDPALDIIVGKPVVQAVKLERTTGLPRVEISEEVLALVAKSPAAQRFVYNDGEKYVLNICNVSDDWIRNCLQKLEAGLKLAPDAKDVRKWEYMAHHLRAMQTAAGG